VTHGQEDQTNGAVSSACTPAARPELVRARWLVHATICCLAEQRFRDAGVKFHRVDSRGDPYSIAEDAASEFLRWDDMPWE
jgi:hypothetical protein